MTRIVLPFLLAAAAVAQQQPAVGIPYQPLGDGPWVFDTAEQHKIRVSIIARGIPHPFSLAILPNGEMLVTERAGRIRAIRNGVLDPEPVLGAPKIFRQRGLYDIVPHPDFATNRLLYITYAKPGDQENETILTLARATYDGKQLSELTDIYRGHSTTSSSGSRIAFGTDGLLYMTSGAPFDDSSQKLDSELGKILRLRDDGSPAPGNPFANQAGARPEVYSYGHRDQLGLTVHPNGSVLAVEHGPNGGDEVNLIQPGRNYGWPISSFGRTYQGPRQSEAPWREGIEQPLVLWIPSIGITGLAVYTGDRFPAWKGNLFVGSAREGEIPGTGHLDRVVLNEKLEELRRESLFTQLGQRFRDVRQGADGLLYAITDENDGVVVRIEPVE